MGVPEKISERILKRTSEEICGRIHAGIPGWILRNPLATHWEVSERVPGKIWIQALRGTPERIWEGIPRRFRENSQKNFRRIPWILRNQCGIYQSNLLKISGMIFWRNTERNSWKNIWRNCCKILKEISEVIPGGFPGRVLKINPSTIIQWNLWKISAKIPGKCLEELSDD